MPKFYEERHTSNYKALFNLIKEKHGWEVVYSNTLDQYALSSYDVAMLYNVPLYNRIGLMMDDYYTLPKDLKLIGYNTDIHTYGYAMCEVEQMLWFDRYDLILSDRGQYFRDEYGDYVSKYKFFPDFIEQEMYIDIPYNSKPLRNFLLSGAMEPDIYPIRNHIRLIADDYNIAYASSQFKTGKEYPKFLNKFFGCVTDASIFKIALKKYFEIPAAGSLLLAERCQDVDDVGHEPGETYVELDQFDIPAQMNRILDDWRPHLDIIKQGREFVFTHHTQYNRLAEFEEHVEAIL